MVKQQRRSDRCFLPAADISVAQVQFPVASLQRRQPPAQQVSEGKWTSGTTTTEEDGGDVGPDGGPGETESKRARLDGCEEAACQPADQQGSAEPSEESRAAELQSVGSLKVTIQQSSQSREFGETDRTADRQTGGLHCHVCDVTCRSAQVFQEHMSGSDHLRKLQEITHSICLSAPPLQGRGRRPDSQRWCDSCRTHFSGDLIAHRRTTQHKESKRLSRPFCPVCRRHFRTPRKFVEHMKSPEHKQQVQLEEVQEEELITVDAVGCFKGEEEEEEEEADVGEEEEDDAGTEEGGEKVLETGDTDEAGREGFDPHDTYGSSFVVPVSGFVCRLCNKFFYKETTARHKHCRTQEHHLNLKSRRVRSRNSDCGGETDTHLS